MSRPEELVCRVRITYRGRELQLCQAISQLDLDRFQPWRTPVVPEDFAEFSVSGERRQRLVDMMSATIAMALTNALLDQ